MMLSAFGNIETVHIAAYSHLLDTVGMPEVEYQAFMKYKEMKDKFEYMQESSMETRKDIAKTMALFSCVYRRLAALRQFRDPHELPTL